MGSIFWIDRLLTSALLCITLKQYKIIMSQKETNTELFRPCTFLASQVLHRHVLSTQLMLKSLPLPFSLPLNLFLSEVGV